MYDLDWLCFARLFGLALIACAYPETRRACFNLHDAGLQSARSECLWD